jgi:hypothetical protein
MINSQNKKLFIHHFLFFSKIKLYSEVFDLFDSIDRIDPKRKNAKKIFERSNYLVNLLNLVFNNKINYLKLYFNNK